MVVLLVGGDAADLRLIGTAGAARCLCDHGIAAGRAGRGSPGREWGGSGGRVVDAGRGAGWVCDWGAVLVWRAVRAAVGAVDGG